MAPCLPDRGMHEFAVSPPPFGCGWPIVILGGALLVESVGHQGTSEFGAYGSDRIALCAGGALFSRAEPTARSDSCPWPRDWRQVVAGHAVALGSTPSACCATTAGGGACTS